MRQVIDGLTYNTETATEVGAADNIGTGASSWSDFSAWSATLYRTKNDRYFLAGEGGPMTRFGRPTGDGGTSGGERIIPLSREAALEWAEQNLKIEEVEAEFGDMIGEA